MTIAASPWKTVWRAGKFSTVLGLPEFILNVLWFLHFSPAKANWSVWVSVSSFTSQHCTKHQNPVSQTCQYFYDHLYYCCKKFLPHIVYPNYSILYSITEYFSETYLVYKLFLCLYLKWKYCFKHIMTNEHGILFSLWNIKIRKTIDVWLLLSIFTLTLKITDFSHSAHLIGIPMMEHPLLFCVNLIKGLFLLSKLPFHFNNNPIYTRTSRLNIEST